MSHNNLNLDPHLSPEQSDNGEGSITEVEAANDDNQVLNKNEDCRQVEAEADNLDMIRGAFGNALGINVMDISELIRNNDPILNINPVRDADFICDNDFIMSVSNRNKVSEDEEISHSEYSDEEDMDMEKTLKVAEDVAPLLLRSPSSPPSYSPPPTPVLRLLPMFALGPGMSSASAMAFFDDQIRYAIRINARKVCMHDTRLTPAEEQLRQLPGIWWQRTSKVPSSLRRCWTPYDIFDEYLENTLVAVNDYGAEEAELETEIEVSK